MGKILTIYGADFSANAVDNLSGGYWLFDNQTIANSNTNLNNERTFWPSGEDVSAMVRGKHITKVRFKCGAVGDVVIQHVTTMLASTAQITTLATITCTSQDVDTVVERDVDILFPNSGFMAVNNAVAGVAQYLYDQSITTAVVELNPVYTNVDAKIVRSRFFNNDFFISYS